MSNIRQLPTPDTDALAADVEKFRRALPYLMENAKLLAKLRRATYSAYIAEGFTPREALELIRQA